MSYKILALGQELSYHSHVYVNLDTPTSCVISNIVVHCRYATGYYTYGLSQPAVTIFANKANYGTTVIWKGILDTGESVHLNVGLSLSPDDALQIFVDDSYNGDAYDITVFGADGV